MPQRVERKLMAIVPADVAGYSRLMGADEEGTLTRLKAYRHSLVDPTIAEHRGRIIKTTGDGLLAEFPSAVDAVRCAIEVQRGMIAGNVDLPAKTRFEFRMGINVGDMLGHIPLPAKIRPTVPGATSSSFSSTMRTDTPCSTRPAVVGASRKSAGPATLT